jgi:hypothetical protein
MVFVILSGFLLMLCFDKIRSFYIYYDFDFITNMGYLGKDSAGMWIFRFMIVQSCVLP